MVDLEEIIRGELDENTVRKDFRPSEYVAITAALRPIEEKAARDRQREHAGTAPGQSAKLSQSEPARAIDKIAARVGVSGRTIEKAEKVVAATAREPEMFAPLVEEMNRTGKVDAAYQQVRESCPRLTKPPSGSLDAVLRLCR